MGNEVSSPSVLVRSKNRSNKGRKRNNSYVGLRKMKTGVGSISSAVKTSTTRLIRRSPKKRNSKTPRSKPVSQDEQVGGTTWFEKQKKRSDPDMTTTKNMFEELFQQLTFRISATMSGNISRKEITKPLFITVCKRIWGEEIDSSLFLKLFDFIDVDKNGSVDELEFSVVACFLLNSKKDKTNTEIAFRIFDTDRSGLLDQKEFSEMLAALVGNSLGTVLHIPTFGYELEKFTKKQLRQDSLEFYKTMKPYMMFREMELAVPIIPLLRARKFANKFIEEEGEMTINVSHRLRTAVLEEVNNAENNRATSISASIFNECFDAIVYGLESQLLPEFKTFLRTKPYSSITEDVWKRFEVEPKDGITEEQFTIWAKEMNGLFSFLDDMVSKFASLIDTTPLM